MYAKDLKENILDLFGKSHKCAWISDKDKTWPRDLQANANDGGSSAADDLDAVAESAVEHWDREEGHDAPQQDEHLVFQLKKEGLSALMSKASSF